VGIARTGDDISNFLGNTIKPMRIRADIKNLKRPDRANFLQRFFKTAPGEYAHGDIFYGLSVPESRSIAKKHKDLEFPDLKILLASKVHEERLIALIILCEQFRKADPKAQEKIFKFLMKNRKGINNWDLVDTAAPAIFSVYLFENDRSILPKLAKSKNLWERRIAIMSTFHFIRQGDFADTLKIAKILLNDDHDLIHKAVGWLLREVGKRDVKVEKAFLDKYADKMPRTMLRYAIEKFQEKERKHYLQLKAKCPG
jgi:3-methyladenine DNA glycosylase AlkD